MTDSKNFIEDKTINNEELLVKNIDIIELYGKDEFFCYIDKFLDYINNFPPINGEKINRLRYYFSSLCNIFDKKNLNSFTINSRVDNKIKSIFKSNNKDNFKSELLSIIVVINTYKQIINLIPKKNIFTRNIKYKIDRIVDFFDKNLIIENNDITMKDIMIKLNDVVQFGYFKELSSRQMLRNNYIDFNNGLYFKY